MMMADSRTPLLSDEPQVSAPAAPMVRRDSTKRMSRARSHPEMRESDDGQQFFDADDGAGPSSSSSADQPWGSFLFARCCGRRKHAEPPITSTRSAPAAKLPSRIDLRSPEGAAFAQLAGGVWVSQLLARLWPHIARTVEKSVIDMFPALVEASTPKWMEGVTLDKFTLGDNPPVVRSVHVDPVDDDDVAEVRLHMELEWHSETDVQLTVKPLPAAVSKWTPSALKSVVSYVTSLTCGVQQVAIKAQVLVTLAPLVDTLPVVRAAQVCLLRAPDVDFNITLTRGQMGILNYIKPWLASTIAAGFAPLVIPEHVCTPLEPGAPDVQKPEGVLLVRVVKADNVPKMDYFGTSDTYVDLWVRGRVKRRTAVVRNSLNPEWPEEGASFLLLVHTRQYQSLTLELWDEDNEIMDATDDFIGTATLPLKDLKPREERMHTLQVVNSGNAARVGVEVDAANAGGSSRVDVSNTKVTVAVQYIPANTAHFYDVGCPGVLHLHTSMIHVPDLALLPLKVRPVVRGQAVPPFPPMSHSLLALTGDEASKCEIPFWYDAVWDVLGDAKAVSASQLIIELVSKAGTAQEVVHARFELPLSTILSRPVPNTPGGICGGEYVMAHNGFTMTFNALFNPLLGASDYQAASSSGQQGVGLQQLLHSQSDSAVVHMGLEPSGPVQGGAGDAGGLFGFSKVGRKVESMKDVAQAKVGGPAELL